MRRRHLLLPGALAGVLVLPAVGAGAVPEGPEHPSPEWFQREAENFALTQEEPRREASDPAFGRRLQEQSVANFQEFAARQVSDPEFQEEGNLCATWGEQCAGDPFRYPGVDDFYDDAQVVPVELADSGGARLSGRVWAPAGARPGDDLPGVVVMNGSVQASEPLYWFLAQALVEQGYVVMTFDPRGQGRSDTTTPDGTGGSNANSPAFTENLVDVVDFFRSSPEQPYPHLVVRPATPAGTPFNPLHELVDPERFGVVGHSLGAAAVSNVQGYADADWPGLIDDANPVDVAVAHDDLGVAPSLDPYPGATPRPRVPALGMAGDYGLTPQPYTEPPDPEEKKAGYLEWQAEGVPSMQVTVRGGTHYDYSQIPTFPARSWDVGVAMAEFYTVAWVDRWLKEPGEPGFADAESRLLDDARWCTELSFYHRTARDFGLRDGGTAADEDVRATCLSQVVADGGGGGTGDDDADPGAPTDDGDGDLDDGGTTTGTGATGTTGTTSTGTGTTGTTGLATSTSAATGSGVLAATGAGSAAAALGALALLGAAAVRRRPSPGPTDGAC